MSAGALDLLAVLEKAGSLLDPDWKTMATLAQAKELIVAGLARHEPPKSGKAGKLVLA